ncbi:MAG TPA: hypothetical protein VGA69_10485 [Nitriliruptorales bacterium]
MTKRRDGFRRYVPLSSSLLAALMAIFVLPSALNVPQSNPTQTLEFAPVPPEDDAPPPPDAGNVESLSLGTSSNLIGDAAGGDGAGAPLPDAPPPPGVGAVPVTKRCVGEPPRQTEDPMSPPCVAHFEGDNGGATYHGVDADEIRIVFIWDSRFCDQPGNEVSCCPESEYVDLDREPRSDDCFTIQILHALLRHFNERYQTYGRHVHGWIWFNEALVNDEARSPEQVRAAALANIHEIDPFAGLNYQRGFADAWTETIADADRVVISPLQAREAEFYRRYPGRVWSYSPSLDEQARTYAAQVCRQIVPFPVSFSGNPPHQGQPRMLGLLKAEDPNKPSHTTFAAIAKREIEACGGEFAEERSYPAAGRSDGFRNEQNNATHAPGNMAAFQQAGVTTVVWAQAYETTHSRAGAQIGYRPEWIIAGDNQGEGYNTGQLQDQSSFDGHAWVITTQPQDPPMEQRPCYLAAQEGDANVSTAYLRYNCAIHTYYRDLRLLFTGIQVAGPRLTPESMDRGFHAIPAYRSADPSIPACYFAPGDYTCIKDAAAWYWDADGNAADGSSGCWRASVGGQRHTAETWPQADVLTLATSSDPCSRFVGPLNS